MKIGIAADNTMPLHIPTFIEFMCSYAPSYSWIQIKSPVRFTASGIDYENEIKKIPNTLLKETETLQLSILITSIPYENNFFYIGNQKITIISFANWHHLTNLPISNGLAYMICSILIKYYLKIGRSHDENVGCINDFWWDKTGIDIGMRAAFICPDCRSISSENPHMLSREYNDIQSLLNVISDVSRRNDDILNTPSVAKNLSANQFQKTGFSAFLCHNSQDKAAVRELNKSLKKAGLRPWLDEDQIEPGQVWQDVLEQVISEIDACLVIVGDSGSGPWQEMEQRAFITEFANRRCRIIPVLIGNPERPPALPLFLKQFTWSDLRNDDGTALDRVVSALKKPLSKKQ